VTPWHGRPAHVNCLESNPGYSPQRHRDHREDQEENEVNTFFRLSKKMQGALLTFVNSADFSVFSVPLW
jgi:hypothetical protein